MKNTAIFICILAFSFSDGFAIGLNSKAMAERTTLTRLNSINNIKKLPLGFDVESYVNKKKSTASSDEYFQRIQRLAILLAINFTVWDKYSYSDSNDNGDRISSYIPLILMAQMSLSKFGVDANSVFLRNFIVGMWLGYYKDGRNFDSFNFENTYSTFMIGVLATLYLNEYFSMTDSAILLYVTLKMGALFHKNTFTDYDYNDTQSETKFGIFPAFGAEYFLAKSFAIFAAIGYNPYGWMEFGLRLNIGK